MTEQKQIYKCNVCGNTVEVLHAGAGQLICCGQPMDWLKEKTKELGKEKHVPVITRTPTGTKVAVGAVPHPMEQEHYISWIELIADGQRYLTFLKPGDKPEIEFKVKVDKAEARIYCNIHGLWQGKK
ncbi:desulfoferrodoxin [Candidatus Woesearchaeota archaeon]|nr:desulfoferrodoxin [Candidatus Woesearchaeota archaeon]